MSKLRRLCNNLSDQWRIGPDRIEEEDEQETPLSCTQRFYLQLSDNLYINPDLITYILDIYQQFTVLYTSLELSENSLQSR